MGKIDLEGAERIVSAIETLDILLSVMSPEELDVAIAVAKRARSTAVSVKPESAAAEKPEPTGHKTGPDKRGHFTCPKCRKVLPTKRGRNVHESLMHGKEV